MVKNRARDAHFKIISCRCASVPCSMGVQFNSPIFLLDQAGKDLEIKLDTFELRLTRADFATLKIEDYPFLRASRWVGAVAGAHCY